MRVIRIFLTKFLRLWAPVPDVWKVSDFPRCRLSRLCQKRLLLGASGEEVNNLLLAGLRRGRLLRPKRRIRSEGINAPILTH